jgi:hypothetical protein
MSITVTTVLLAIITSVVFSTDLSPTYDGKKSSFLATLKSFIFLFASTRYSKKNIPWNALAFSFTFSHPL